MINGQQRRLVHQYLLLDLAIQSLRRDYSMMEQLRMKAIYLPFMDNLLTSVRQDYLTLKRQLAQQKIYVIGWHRIDTYFSDVHLTTAGNEERLRYANQALKMQVEQLLMTYINK